MSFYLAGEKFGSFIVDTTVGNLIYFTHLEAHNCWKASRVHGRAWDVDPALNDQSDHRTGTIQATKGDDEETLTVRVTHRQSGLQIIPHATIRFNETGKEFIFSTETFDASYAPQTVILELTHVDGRIFRATTGLYYLPYPRPTQSITRIDSLYGGLHVRSNGPAWQTIFPYTFYLSGDWLASDPGNLKRFQNFGFNVLHIVPGGAGIGYDLDQLDTWFDEAEKLGLWIMYDMRWTYQNTGYVRTQVERCKTRSNMLLYYTADEPDGHEDDPDAPSRSYAFIKSLDPYHPISLCLNCQNYYFQRYTAGTDIILADIYPVGTNTSYSTKYQTPCNNTYGDCGCDNCMTSPTSPALANIPARLDLWSSFRAQLGLPHKPIWSVPQAFTQQDFWTRTPSPQELVAMILLSLNHGAKGVVMWLYPTAGEIVGVASEFSKVMWAGKGLVAFLSVVQAEAVPVSGAENVDAAMWRVGNRMMVTAINAGENKVEGKIRLDFEKGFKIKGLSHVLWGSGQWKIEDGRALIRTNIDGVESCVLVVDVEGEDKGVTTT
ncbi:hypothetical protein XPA_008488 [Xanthoria parietina]